MTRIYTRSGDDGTTGLADGSRIDKGSLRIELVGTLDELNAHLGIVLVEPLHPELTQMITPLQHQLFDLGAEIALSPHSTTIHSHVLHLEKCINQLQQQLPELKQFILPGGSSKCAQLHLARTVCRQAERLAKALHDKESLNVFILHYLNRLSDLLFVAARFSIIMDNKKEVYWQPHNNG